MDNVKEINPKRVTHRCCPECGYLMSQLEIGLIKFELQCPRCGNHSINEFQPISMNEG